MQILLDKIRGLPQYQSLLKNLAKPQPLGLPRSARLPVLAALHADLNQPILLLTDRAADAALTFVTEGLNAAMNQFNGGVLEEGK